MHGQAEITNLLLVFNMIHHDNQDDKKYRVQHEKKIWCLQAPMYFFCLLHKQSFLTIQNIHKL